MTGIKICGITRKKDIRNAVKLRVNALGFILADSPRKISLKKAGELMENIPPFISRVGVVVDPEKSFLKKIVKGRLFDYIQFHGNESPALFENFPLKIIKAVSIKEKDDLNVIAKYKNKVDYFLFDTKTNNQKGGTGKTFEWDLLNKMDIQSPYILAGGLGPDNIFKALEKLNPAAVDLNSCLEDSPGKKNNVLMKKAVKKIYSF